MVLRPQIVLLAPARPSRRAMVSDHRQAHGTGEARRPCLMLEHPLRVQLRRASQTAAAGLMESLNGRLPDKRLIEHLLP